MPGGGNQTQSTQTNEPWEDAQPHLRRVLSGAEAAYSSGKGFDYFPGSTVVPFSSETQSAMSGIRSLANQGNPLATASRDQALGILNSGGMSDWQRSALQGTHDIATGARSIGTESDLRGLLSESSNPYFERVVDREAGKLSDDLNRGFSNSGRYGSGAHVGALGDTVGDFREQAMSNQWNQNIANQRGILSDITGVQGANLANMAGAGSQINSAGNAAAGLVGQFAQMAPSIYDSLFAPQERLASVGAMQEDLSSRTLQDQIARFQSEQNEPWARLNAYNALIGGAGALGGTQTSMVPAPSLLQQILGGGVAGLGLLGGLL